MLRVIDCLNKTRYLPVSKHCEIARHCNIPTAVARVHQRYEIRAVASRDYWTTISAVSKLTHFPDRRQINQCVDFLSCDRMYCEERVTCRDFYTVGSGWANVLFLLSTWLLSWDAPSNSFTCDACSEICWWIFRLVPMCTNTGRSEGVSKFFHLLTFGKGWSCIRMAWGVSCRVVTTTLLSGVFVEGLFLLNLFDIHLKERKIPNIELPFCFRKSKKCEILNYSWMIDLHLFYG